MRFSFRERRPVGGRAARIDLSQDANGLYLVALSVAGNVRFTCGEYKAKIVASNLKPKVMTGPKETPMPPMASKKQ